MADDLDGPTHPGVPFEPADSEDGPTLRVHVPLDPPGLDTATLPRFRSAEPGDADETLTLPRPAPHLDEVATTPLAPVRLPADATRPFPLIAAPTATAPFPLVARADARAVLAPPVLPPQPAPGRAPARSARALWVFVAGVLGTLAVALVIVVSVLVARRALGSSQQAAPETASTVTSPPTAGRTAGACALEQPARQIAAAVVATVPPMTGQALGPGEVAVGYASEQQSAMGVVVDTADLSIERRFSRRYARPVFRATPFERDGSLEFLVDHDDPRLQSPRSVPARPPFVLGVSYFGVVRATGGEPETLWPGGKGAGIGEPAFASARGVGHAVAFTRERTLHVGWLGERGRPRTDLAALGLASGELGPPSIAASERAIVVVVAARTSATARWQLAIASAATAELPRRLEWLDAGAGPDRSAPAVTALSNGGWLISWVEGSIERRLRAQAFDAELRRVGAPTEVSAAAGIAPLPGALQRVGERVLSLHLTHGERGYSLWGAVLGCS